MVAQAVFANNRTPRGIGRDGIEQIGVAAGAGLGDDGGQFGIVLGQCVSEQFGDRPEQFGESLPGGLGQVIDAHAHDAQCDIRRIGIGAGAGLQRPLRQAETGTGAQRAHGRAGLPQVAARFVGLHLQQRIAARLGAVGVEVLAGRIKAFQQRRVGTAHGARGRYAGGHGFFGLVVVTEHGGRSRRSR